MRTPAYPSWIQFETTVLCQGRCVTCGNSEIQGTRPYLMGDYLLKKILDELEDHKDYLSTIVPFCTGDPLEDPRIFRILKQLDERIGGSKVMFNTNGYRLSDRGEELKNAFQEGWIGALNFSVDGLEHYGEIRTGLDRQEIYENILNFLEGLPPSYRRKVNIHMTVTPENIQDLRDFTVFWESMGASASFMPCDGRTGGHALTSPSPLPCARLLWSNLYVLSNGVCVPCCCDYRGDHPLGNLTEQSISEIWHGEPYQQIREQHLKIRKEDIPLCAACKAWY